MMTTTQNPTLDSHETANEASHSPIRERRNLVEALWQAAQDGDAARIRELVSLGVDVTIRNDQGWTPLHIATRHGHAEAMRTLIAARSMQRMARAGIDLRNPSLTWNEALQSKSVSG